MTLPNFIRQMVSCSVRDRLETPGHHVLENLILQEACEGARLVAPDAQDALADVLEVPVFAVDQMGTAPAATAAAAALPSSTTMSTRRPRASSKSIASSVISLAPRPGSRSSRRSTSLSGRASPRAAEPNTRTFLPPCRATRGTIASRRSLRARSVGRENISARRKALVRRRISTERRCTRSRPPT